MLAQNSETFGFVQILMRFAKPKKNAKSGLDLAPEQHF